MLHQIISTAEISMFRDIRTSEARENGNPGGLILNGNLFSDCPKHAHKLKMECIVYRLAWVTTFWAAAAAAVAAAGFFLQFFLAFFLVIDNPLLSIIN